MCRTMDGQEIERRWISSREERREEKRRRKEEGRKKKVERRTMAQPQVERDNQTPFYALDSSDQSAQRAHSANLRRIKTGRSLDKKPTQYFVVSLQCGFDVPRMPDFGALQRG